MEITLIEITVPHELIGNALRVIITGLLIFLTGFSIWATSTLENIGERITFTVVVGMLVIVLWLIVLTVWGVLVWI